MVNFNWLHLTDLHRGMNAQRSIWPNIEEEFYNDLTRLYDRCGPWDLILFTGDLVQKGDVGEFALLDKTLKRLNQHLLRLDSKPVFLAVPGNHDLIRPTSDSPSLRLLKEWATHPEIQREFWLKPKCSYRKVVSNSFKNYVNWYDNHKLRRPKHFTPGLLPGDFSATVKKEGVSLGVIGLNSTFLQLTEGDYQGKLALDSSQLVGVCGANFTDWFDKHDLCLFMTHHPPEWLTPESKEKLDGEIYPPGRFVAHLYGHMHEHRDYSISTGGEQSRRYWQACSLFGLESYGEKQKADRRHGYIAGRIEIEGDVGHIRLWPRVATRHRAGHWQIIRDPLSNLEIDEGTSAESFNLRRKVTDSTDRGKEPKLSPALLASSDPVSPPALKPYLFTPLPVKYVLRSRKSNVDEKLLKILIKKLSPSKDKVNLIVLSGPAGTGKTATAQEAVKAVSKKYLNRVIWVDAENNAGVSLPELIDEILRRFDPNRKPPKDRKSRKLRARLLLDNGPVLIAIDDFDMAASDEFSNCIDWIRSKTGCTALLIAREQFLERSMRGIDEREEVDNMTIPEAAVFWKRLVKQWAQHDDVFRDFTPEQVVGKFGTNPFILFQGVFMHVAEQADWETVEKHGLATERVKNRYFSRSFESSRLGDKERRVLLALSLFTPNAERRALADVAGLGSDTDGFADAVAKLRTLWLVSPALTRGRLTMDKLNRRYAKAYLKHHRLANELQGHFVKYFAHYVESHGRTTVKDFNAIETEKDNIFEAMSLARNDPRSLTTMFGVLGRTHNGFFEHRGYWNVALANSEHALKAAQEIGDKAMLERFTCIAAGLNLKFSKNEDARRLLQPLIEGQSKPVDEQAYIDALHFMGMLEFTEHNYKNAEKFFRLELAACEEAGSDEIKMRGLANSTQELGRIARLRGKFKSAREFYERSFEARKKLKGPDGSDDIGAPKSSFHDLGLLAHQEGEWEEQFGNNPKRAGELYDEALSSYKQARSLKEQLGNDSSLAHTLTEMAELTRLRAGRESSKREKTRLYKEARNLLMRSLEIKEELEDKAHAAYTKYILGRVALDEGKLTEAQRWCGESRNVRNDNNDRAGIAGCRYLGGLIAEQQGERVEAARLFRLAHDTWKKMGLVAADYAEAALRRVGDEPSSSPAGKNRRGGRRGGRT